MRRWYGIMVGVALALVLAWFFLVRPDAATTVAAPPSSVHATHSGSAKAEPKIASIAGTVVDETKQPIGGARICASGQGGKPACVSANAAGAFVIRELASGTYRLVGGADHHLPARLADVAANRTDVVLLLQRGGVEVTGTVSDRGGGAISHARVQASSDTVQTPWVETDDAGKFELWSAPGSIWLDASADGYTDGGATDKAPAHDVPIVLEPESVLAGMVTDATTKQPVAGATVFIVSAAGDSGQQGATDEAGHFEIHGLSAGRYSATARSRSGYGRSDGSVALPYRGRVDGVLVELRPAASLVGSAVIAGSPDRPCANARVEIDGESKTAGVDGTFRIDGIAPGKHDVGVWCEMRVRLEDWPPIEFAAGELARTFRFGEKEAPGPLVRGVVRDDAGVPVVGATVNGGHGAKTGADGRYEVEGARSYLSARTEHASSDLVKIEPTRHEYDLVVHSDGAVAGVVVDRAGNPVRGAHVFVSCRCFGYPEEVTDAAGTFRFADVPADPDIGIIVDLGHTLTRQDVAVAWGKTTTLRIAVDGGAAQITGIVRDESGAPRGDVIVTASGEHSDGFRLPRVETGADGKFAVNVGASGFYTVEAHRGGAPSAKADHLAPGSDVTLQFVAAGSIAGVARDSGGKQLDDFVITLTPADRGASERFYQTAGRFHLEGLAAGHYELVASIGADSGSTSLELAAGEHATTTITIDRSLTITGRILDLVGHGPISGAHVYVQAGTGHSGESGSDGRFVIRDVKHGDLHLSAHAGGYVLVMIDRTATTGATVDVGDLYTSRVRPGPDGYRDWGSLGLELAPDRTITGFDKGSPAPAAGIVVGDVITGVDGLDVTLASGSVIAGMTNAILGTVIRVTVARGPTYALSASSAR